MILLKRRKCWITLCLHWIVICDSFPVFAAGQGYILEFSDHEYIHESDLKGLSKTELRIARNEILARHGRRFNDQSLQDYFDRCDWYEGTIAAEEFDDSVLNDYEIKNISFIKNFEENGVSEISSEPEYGDTKQMINSLTASEESVIFQMFISEREEYNYYMLLDINQDGVSELLTAEDVSSDGTAVNNEIDLFGIVDGQVTFLCGQIISKYAPIRYSKKDKALICDGVELERVQGIFTICRPSTR